MVITGAGAKKNDPDDNRFSWSSDLEQENIQLSKYLHSQVELKQTQLQKNFLVISHLSKVCIAVALPL